MTALQLDGVCKSLGGAPVLTGVSLRVPAGTRTAIVGASGSGKSTLLRLIAGFETPDAGAITLGDVVVAGGPAPVPAHRRGVGYVAQDGALFPHLTVARNIRFGLPSRGDRAARDARVREVAELVALDPALLERYPHELSGGQQQRVALARALAPEPAIILLDEPFSSLDTGLRAQTRQAVIEALERSGVTTILVTHDQEEALSFGPQIAVIVAGEIVQAGPPAEVFDDPVTEATALFLGEAIVLDAEVSNAAAHCALGALEVRHDRRASGASAARVLVRPGQVTMQSDAPVPNATVLAATVVGAHVDVTLALSEGMATVRLRLNTADPHLAGCVAGARMRLDVRGGVVVY